MAFTTVALLKEAAPGQELIFAKSGTTGISGGYTSLWNIGTIPGAAAGISNATTGVIPTSATPGAFTFVNPPSGESYIFKTFYSGQQLGTVIFYDRLWHAGTYSFVNGTISANTTTAIDRDSTGQGAELFVEIVGNMSAVACNLTITYVNQDGTGGRTATCNVGASTPSNRMIPVNLQSGDTGIRQITNIVGDAAPTGTFNLVILRRLFQAAIKAINQVEYASWEDLMLPRVYDNAAIAMMIFGGAGNTGFVNGSFNLAQG